MPTCLQQFSSSRVKCDHDENNRVLRAQVAEARLDAPTDVAHAEVASHASFLVAPQAAWRWMRRICRVGTATYRHCFR